MAQVVNLGSTWRVKLHWRFFYNPLHLIYAAFTPVPVHAPSNPRC